MLQSKNSLESNWQKHIYQNKLIFIISMFFGYNFLLYENQFFLRNYPHRLIRFIRNHELSLVVSKTAFCICENKDANQLRGGREADQRLCFHYIGITIPLLPKSETSSHYLSSVVIQPGLYQTGHGFLTMRLN